MASITQPAAPTQKTRPLIKDHADRRMFALSDDNALMKQIQTTHAPDGREVNVKPVLFIIGDILRLATPSIDGILSGTQEHVDAEDKTGPAGLDDILEALAYLIYKISCELSCKCSGGGDAHGTTMALLNTLTTFPWDSKVVLTLAAFAVNYGEFWMVAQLCTKNPLAKSVAFLKQLPNIIEYSNSLKHQFEALYQLIKAIMGVTTCIVDFKELPSQFMSMDDTPAAKVFTAHLPAATYWTIRSIVACATLLSSLIGLRLEHNAALTTEAWELSSLAHKVSNIHEHLKSQLALCYRQIEEKRNLEYFHTLIRLFETLHVDNSKILRALLYPSEELLFGSSMKMVNIDVLKRKHVLLLISDLDIALDEISILGHIYQDKLMNSADQSMQYEVIWFPIMDRSSPHSHQEKFQKFKDLQLMMPWYSVIDPWNMETAVTKYIKEVWRFNKRSILVSLDPQGRVISINALHMMWIWGTVAFPFSSEKENALWKSQTWGLTLLIDGIDQNIMELMDKGSIICLYGGEDIEWIRKFTTAAKTVAKAAAINLYMVYVGRSNAKERVQKTNSIIKTEQLSPFWDDLTLIWFFWKRLESMLFSKLQNGKNVDENDTILQEVMTMLSFDGSDKGWAVVCGGFPNHDEIIARGKGELVLKSMQDFEKWKDDADQIGFVAAFKEHLGKLHTPQHCNRLILPGFNGGIPEKLVCADCRRPMEKYLMYCCCTD